MIAAIESFDPWRFQAHPSVWVMVAGIALLYLWAVRVLGPRVLGAGATVTTKGQQVRFWSGLAVMWVASDWPMHDLADGSLYSAHMTQHLLLSLVVPPLLLSGVPRWLADELLRSARLEGFVGRFGRAVPAALIFNAYVVISHWPAFVTRSVESAPFHLVGHVALVGTAMLMWTPVVGPWTERRLAPLTAMLYLFLQSVIPTVPGAWLTFADQAVYTVYADMPKPWGVSVLSDQQAAGLIMKLAGGFYLWGWIAVLFFRWSAQHEREQRHSFRADPAPPVDVSV